MPQRFTEDELRQLQEAVAHAETRTAGEIVPVIVRRSGRYSVALWRGAGGGVLLALLFSSLIFRFYDGWGLGWLHEGWGVALLTLLCGLAGALLTEAIPPLKRLLVGTAALSEQVHLRAMRAFVEEEVFNTRGRTGILLFISVFEHRIEVLADKGISSVIPPEAWGDLVLKLRDGIRQGRLADALIESFADCGALLESCGIALQSDDVDELHNHVRIYES